ncbi:MAG: serine/threonine protein kinase [Planctomycetota bacterium]|jgi:serine/threonine-protein kinase
MPDDSHYDLDFVTVAIGHKLVSREEVERCQEILDKEMLADKEERKIEDIMVDEGILGKDEVWAVYKAQNRMSRDAKTIRHRIGGYEIIQKIGEGGLGVVYRAQQLSMGRDVALKVLHEKWVADEEFRKRFLVEARLVGRLSHQNLIQVYDVGRYKNTYYYSMEFIDGETVEDIIDRNGPMPALHSLDIIFQLVRAIQYLNQFNIVHRDIKPGNIMYSKSGVAKLGDFGFVKSNLENIISSEGEILGTPDYISPEAALGETDLDFRSDVYSLGATFYHMLTGDSVFKGTPSEVMDKHITDDPIPLKKINPLLSDHLCLVVEKMMNKRREDRYQSASSLFDDLELLRLGERSAAGENEAGKSTVIRALERGSLRMKLKI